MGPVWCARDVDHILQRLVGGSLAAERSTVDDVRDHLRHLKRKQLEVVETDEDFDFEEKLRLLKQVRFSARIVVEG
jgi:hypothetical protein